MSTYPLSDPEEVENPNDLLALQDTDYHGPDIATDERVIAEDVFQDLGNRVPGWVARDGNLEVWLIEAWARNAATIRSEAANVPASIFSTYGQEVLGLPRIAPEPARGRATWTAVDSRGYSIPAGTQFTIARTGDDLVAFSVVTSAVIPPGETSVSGVLFVAVEPGVNGNDLSGEGEIVDPLVWIESIAVEGATANGVEGQTETEYVDDLISLLRVVALRPILPGDFAILSLRVPQVARAIAMDLYNPADGTWDNQRMVTLILTNYQGEPVGAEVRQEVKDMLESLREVNFIVNTIDADYESVSVQYEVTAFAEQNPEFVREDCDRLISDALSPATWRLGLTSPSIRAGEVIPPPTSGLAVVLGRQWVRRYDLVALLYRARGVDWVDSLTINGQASDLQLGSQTTLPRPGTITGAVNEQ